MQVIIIPSRTFGFHHHINFTETSCTFLYIRLQLAALHFNENSSRDQAVTQQGELRYEVLVPKFKRGGYTVRKKRVKPTYSELLAWFTNVFILHAVYTLQ